MLKAEAYRNIKLSSIKLETGHLKQESPITSVSLIFEAGHPEPVLCNNLEGWGGEGGGRGFKMGDTCAPMTDSCQCMAKTTTIL